MNKIDKRYIVTTRPLVPRGRGSEIQVYQVRDTSRNVSCLGLSGEDGILTLHRHEAEALAKKLNEEVIMKIYPDSMRQFVTAKILGTDNECRQGVTIAYTDTELLILGESGSYYICEYDSRVVVPFNTIFGRTKRFAVSMGVVD